MPGDYVWSQHYTSIQIGGAAGNANTAGGTGGQATGTSMIWDGFNKYPSAPDGTAIWPDSAIWEFRNGRNPQAGPDALDGFAGYAPPKLPVRKLEIQPTPPAPAAPLPRRKLFTEE